MRVKVLRQFLNNPQVGEQRIVHPGEEIDVTPSRGDQLIRNRLVTETVGGSMKASVRGPSEAAKGGEPDPTPSAPAGGPTGEGKPASSRPRGRPRKESRST